MVSDDVSQSPLLCGSQEGEQNRKTLILERGGMGSSSVFTIKATWPWNTTNLNLSCLIYKAAVLIPTLQGCLKDYKFIICKCLLHNKCSKTTKF